MVVVVVVVGVWKVDVVGERGTRDLMLVVVVVVVGEVEVDVKDGGGEVMVVTCRPVTHMD